MINYLSILFRCCRQLGLSFVICYCGAVAASNPVTELPFAVSDPGAAGLGAGLRFGRSPYRFVETSSSLKNENNSDLVPLYLYQGKYLFSDGTRAGVHLWNQGIKLDAVAAYRFDRLEPAADDFYRTVDARQQTMEGGFAVRMPVGVGELSVELLQDLQSRHNGYSSELTYRYPWQNKALSITPFVSLVYHSDELVDYYYGVASHEARNDLPEYNASSASFVRVGLNTSYRLLDNLHLFANISWEALDDEVKNSPLVDESALYTAFMGFHYDFGNVFNTRQTASQNIDFSDWSWRVQGGYQGEATFHKIHRGDLQRSQDVHTYLGGVTFGKLLADNDIIDYWGKFSFNRRFENDYQDNFWQYDAYVMAMGTGYSPWSRREVFRYGFGFGFSYAERIPTIEQVKQAKRDEYTAHFLNYLEAQLDFPLRNVTKAKSVRNCYVGMTLIHRSGIFSTSDILGNVAGGSDIIAGHMECKR